MTGQSFDPELHEEELPAEGPPEDEPPVERIDPDVETEPGDDLEAQPVEEPPAERAEGPAEGGDPDLAAARETGSPQRPDVLKTEELRPEEELEEPRPATEPSLETRVRRTPNEALEGESIDERLEQERPEE